MHARGENRSALNEDTVSIAFHRSVIEALSEVDRLLLRSTDLEPILDIVLPSIGKMLGCESASVFLVDRDNPTHVRAYDFLKNSPAKRPVRRVNIDAELLESNCQQTLCRWATAGDGRMPLLLEPLHESGARHFQLCSLHHDGLVRGWLCAGFAQPGATPGQRGIGVTEFADRMSVVIANHQRAEQLYREANFDSLTELPNRRLFHDLLEREVARIGGTGERGVLVYIDLDHFKHINDTEGHQSGDAVLRLVSQRITHCLQEKDTLARLGGDEFGVLLPRVRDLEDAHGTVRAIADLLRRPITIGTREYRLSASIGVTRIPEDGRDVDALLKASDIAMYKSKESGRDQISYFCADMQTAMSRRMGVQAALRRAVQERAFTLAYQPIVESLAGRTVGMEALLRWPDAPQGWQSPEEFVPVAEESGLIVELGRWVLESACREFAALRLRHPQLQYVSVNVSARQLQQAAWLGGVLRTIGEWQLSPSQVQLELTESVLADGVVGAHALRELAATGVRLALDDFGTGYSSLNYLRRFPISTLKIDRSFIADIPGDRRSCRLLESIIRMCHTLGMRSVAEGVESTPQYDFLRGIGCSATQGFLTGRPMSVEQLRAHLQDGGGQQGAPGAGAARG